MRRISSNVGIIKQERYRLLIRWQLTIHQIFCFIIMNRISILRVNRLLINMLCLLLRKVLVENTSNRLLSAVILDLLRGKRYCPPRIVFWKSTHRVMPRQILDHPNVLGIWMNIRKGYLRSDCLSTIRNVVLNVFDLLDNLILLHYSLLLHSLLLQSSWIFVLYEMTFFTN